MPEHPATGPNDTSPVERDRSPPRFHAEHDWDGPDTVGETIVRTVAAVTGADPMAMPPLYDVVDPDALDRLFSPPESSIRAGTGRVEFAYAGCAVTVHGDGQLEIRPASPGRDRS